METILSGIRKQASSHAVATLQIQKDVAETNAPIHEAEGDLKQAELDKEVAASCGNAIDLLEGVRKQAMIKFANVEKMKKKYGITETEKTDPSHCVCSIGYSPKNKKWYGWSHRAVYGFGIGSKVKEGDSGFVPSNKEEFLASLKRWNSKKTKHVEVPGGVRVTSGKYTHTEDYPKPWGKGAWTAKTMDDAKQMAKDFAESVS